MLRIRAFLCIYRKCVTQFFNIYLFNFRCILYLSFLPVLSLPTLPSLPTPCCLSPTPQMPPGVSPHVLIVQHPPMSEYLWCLAFCSYIKFAENDGFQIRPSPYKGHELIVFYGCVVFRGVYVPHFPNPVYHRWAFWLIPGLCYCKQCCNEHSCARLWFFRWHYN